DLQRPEVEVVDDRRCEHLERDARGDEVAGTRRQPPTEMERRRAVPGRRETSRARTPQEGHRPEPTSAKPDARVTAPRIQSHADRDYGRARGAPSGGPGLGGTALRPRRPARVVGRRDRRAAAVLARPGGAGVVGITRRRGARRRGLRLARAGDGTRGDQAGERTGYGP